MKIYATVTSERASKGQGGNKYLEIEVKAEKLEEIPTRANIYRLSLKVEDNRLYAEFHDYSNGTTQDLITFRGQPKGEKQKGDKCAHKNTEWRDENGKSYLNCFDCENVLRIK